MRGLDLEAVRLELATRITAIDGRTPYLPDGELALALDDIRRVAHLAGLHPVVTVAHFIAAALARGERGALVHGWLHILRDAIRTERRDAGACDSFAAACSVRLAA